MSKFIGWKKKVCSLEDVKRLTKGRRNEFVRVCCNFDRVSHGCIWDKECPLYNGDWDNLCNYFSVVLGAFMMENKN